MITEERINELWDNHTQFWELTGKTLISPTVFAKAIEREAYKQGQEDMRERAAVTCFEEAGEYGTDTDGFYTCRTLSDLIDDLEIEEPK